MSTSHCSHFSFFSEITVLNFSHVSKGALPLFSSQCLPTNQQRFTTALFNPQRKKQICYWWQKHWWWHRNSPSWSSHFMFSWNSTFPTPCEHTWTTQQAFRLNISYSLCFHGVLKLPSISHSPWHFHGCEIQKLK